MSPEIGSYAIIGYSDQYLLELTKKTVLVSFLTSLNLFLDCSLPSMRYLASADLSFPGAALSASVRPHERILSTPPQFGQE